MRAPAFRASLFTDVTAESGIDFVLDNGARGDYALFEIMKGGGGFLDFDGDGRLDIHLVNRLYRNAGNGRFVDVTGSSGTFIPVSGMGLAAADYDRDGDVDLYITHVGRDMLLRNNADGTFTDVSGLAGVATDGLGSSAAFLDYDRDGWPDLYVLRYMEWPPRPEKVCSDLAGRRDYCGPTAYKPTTDRLYRNLGDGRFEDVTESAGIDAAAGYGLAVLCSDFDGDGWVDIYVANDQSPAFLWSNQGDGTFAERGLVAGCAFNGTGEAIAGMGTAAEDFDDDGDLDLFVTNIRYRDNLILRNDGGSFEDVGYRWGRWDWLRPYTGFGTVAIDADLDGRLELFVANGAVQRRPTPLITGRPYVEPDQFLRQDDEGRFTSDAGAFGEQLLVPAPSRAVAYGDYDNDGDVDLLVVRNVGPPQLLRNDQQSGNHWLIVATADEIGGGAVLNARITVAAGSRRWLREVRPHQSYQATSDPRVHFGLGAADRVDTLTVQWPDGRREQWRDIAADQIVTIERGAGTPVTTP